MAGLEGAGLELCIVKELVDMMGGIICVQRVPKRGTVLQDDTQ